MIDSFKYFNSKWREERDIAHYLCKCDFDVYVCPVIPDHLISLSKEIIIEKCNKEWNTDLDFSLILTSKKSEA